MEADRTYPIWAFLLSAGLRIGELVALRWPSVDLDARVVRVVEFTSTIGYEVVASAGKSRDAVRTIDLDDSSWRSPVISASARPRSGWPRSTRSSPAGDVRAAAPLLRLRRAQLGHEPE